MAVYLTMLFLALAFAIAGSAISARKAAGVSGLEETAPIPRANLAMTVMVIVVFSFVLCFRDGVGTDYGNYKDVYLVDSYLSWSKLLFASEPLYNLFNKLVYVIFDSVTPVFVVIGALTVAFTVVSLRANSSDFVMSVYMYATMMVYFSAYNGMRQRLAGAILFLIYPAIVKKKWSVVIPALIVCFMIHSSSILFIFFILAAYLKPFSRQSAAVIVLFVLAFIFYDPFVDVLFAVLNFLGSSYSMYEETFSSSGYGANILRFAFSLVPLVLSFIFYDKLRDSRPDIGILINFSLINALFMMLAMRHWIFARWTMYTDVFNLLLWPEIAKVFPPKQKAFFTYVVAVFFFLYMYLLLPSESNLLPYRSLLFSFTAS